MKILTRINLFSALFVIVWCFVLIIQTQAQPIKIKLKLEPNTQSGIWQSIIGDRIKSSENERSGKTPNGLPVLVKRTETDTDKFYVWIDLNNNGKLTDEKKIVLANNEPVVIKLKQTKNSPALPFELSLKQSEKGALISWKANFQAAGKINLGNCALQIYLQDLNSDGAFEHLENGTNFQIDRNNDGKIWGAEEWLYSQEIIDLCGQNFLISSIARDGSSMTIERTNLQIAKVGAETPQFELSLLNGKNVTSDELSGKPFVLDFWASWCIPCVNKLPEAKTLGKEVAVYFINTDEASRVPTAEKIITKNDLRANSVMNGLGENDKLWKTFARINRSLPFYVLVNGNGIIVYAGSGGEDLSELKGKISELQK